MTLEVKTFNMCKQLHAYNKVHNVNWVDIILEGGLPALSLSNPLQLSLEQDGNLHENLAEALDLNAYMDSIETVPFTSWIPKNEFSEELPLLRRC